MRPFLFKSVPIRLERKGVINNNYENNDKYPSKRLPQLKYPRGCRGGQYKKRSIQATISDRIPQCIRTRTVNKANLIEVPRKNVFRNHNSPKIRFASWNARSVRAKLTKRKSVPKSTAVCDFVINNQLDVLAITETWMTGNDKDNRVIADIRNTLPNYQFFHAHRQNGRGGGLAVLARDSLQVRVHDT